MADPMYVRTFTQNHLDALSTNVVRELRPEKPTKQELRDILQLANGLRRKVEALLDRP